MSYLAGDNVTTITGGTFKGSISAFEIRAGKLDISGGSFFASESPTTVIPNGNGPTSRGAAIAIAQHTTKQNLSVNISGGDFSGYTALYESNPQKNPSEDIAKVSISITGGTFNTINGGVNAIYSEDCNSFIKGGAFSSDPSEYLTKGKMAVKGDDGKYAITASNRWIDYADTSWYDSQSSTTSYTISTGDALAGLAKLVNEGNNFSGKTITLVKDIDLAAYEWTPIGRIDKAFDGSFDGNGKTVSNMTAVGTECVGLFGKNHGVIEKVNLKNIKVVGTHWCGGIAGYSTANNGMKIDSCTVDGGSITILPEKMSEGNYDNGDKAGGIIGYMVYGDTVTNNTVSNLQITAYRDIGGIAGSALSDLGVLPIVTGNTVENVVLIQDDTNGYGKPEEELYIGEVVGRYNYKLDESNTAKDVTIKRQ